MISPSTRSIYKISVAAISFILLFASCARELEDEAGKVSSVRLGIDYWDRSSRSFLALRRLFALSQESAHLVVFVSFFGSFCVWASTLPCALIYFFCRGRAPTGLSEGSW